MNARREFEMTEADLAGLLEASKAVPAMFLSGGAPMFGEAWRRLGDRMGFHHMTVEPSRRGQRFFTAEPKPVTIPPITLPDTGISLLNGMDIGEAS